MTHTLQETLQTNEKGSLLSGDSVTLAANQDINLQGSSVVGDKQVTLLANNDVNTAASVENYQNYEEHSKKKSGLFSGGGIGFTIGSTSTSQKLRDRAATQSQSISTLGSTTDSVTVKAGTMSASAAPTWWREGHSPAGQQRHPRPATTRANSSRSLSRKAQG